MFKNPVFICCIALVIGLFGLIQVKMYVQDLNKEINLLKEDKRNLKEEIKVLKTEWAYLTRAERLENLATKYLKVEEPKFIKDIKEFGNKEGRVSTNKIGAASSSTKIIKVKWRYKSRHQILQKIKGLKNIGHHGIIKIKGN